MKLIINFSFPFPSEWSKSSTEFSLFSTKFNNFKGKFSTATLFQCIAYFSMLHFEYSLGLLLTTHFHTNTSMLFLLLFLVYFFGAGAGTQGLTHKCKCMLQDQAVFPATLLLLKYFTQEYFCWNLKNRFQQTQILFRSEF